MEMIATNSPVASAPVQTATQTPAGEGQVSFAQLLYGMTSASNTGGLSTGTQGDSSTGNLSWREMQAMSQMMMDGAQLQNDGSGLSVDSLLMQLFNMLMQVEEEDVMAALDDGEDATAVFDQIEKIRRQMEQLMALGGQAGQSQQMTLLLAQIYELPLTPQIGEDGNITLTLPQNDALAQQLLSSDPAELLAKLTSLPTETIQKLLEAQGTNTWNTGQTAQTAQVPGAQAELPVTQLSAGGQSGLAAFQNSVQAARQQMETVQPAKQETELDVDELQRKVDEGVNFKNTSYPTQTVQSEVKTGQAAPPLLTQVQDGILKGVEQGKDQFSIRLVPEGLGELEVRLTKTAQGMLLNIVTKSAETQRLLTAEIDQLREQMRAYKVDVDSILTQQQDEFLNRQRSFEQQQAWQNGRQGGAHAQSGDDARNNPDPDLLEAIQTTRTTLAGNTLDTYI